MNKLVSIILPTYNGSKWIKKALESVFAQSYTDWELLVIDDGSEDNTSIIVDSYVNKDQRIKYIKNDSNIGIQKTLNKGLKEAKGEYIARIDDDDIWVDKYKLEKQVEFFENNKDYVLVGTGVIMANENGEELFRYLLPEKDYDIKNKLLGKNCFAHSSVLFRKDSAIKCGGYSEDKDTLHIEDYDLWLKLGTIGKLANLPTYSLKYTIRESSLSATNRLEVFRKLLSYLKKHKNNYNNYYPMLIRAYARFVLYSIYIKLPKKFSLNRIIKLYKER
ncbi:glycosyltransferase family 2 protein [Candidatus Nomurabacteria bacterium]|nr:glycosyltransferase family 2 protein [Candidatus Nomurabacteria bacterium]